MARKKQNNTTKEDGKKTLKELGEYTGLTALLGVTIGASVVVFGIASNKYGWDTKEGLLISLILSMIPVFIAIAVGIAIGFIYKINPMIDKARGKLDYLGEEMDKIPNQMGKKINERVTYMEYYTMDVFDDLKTALERDVKSIKAYAPSFGGAAINLIDTFFEETIEKDVEIEVVVGRKFAINENEGKITFSLYKDDDTSMINLRSIIGGVKTRIEKLNGTDEENAKGNLFKNLKVYNVPQISPVSLIVIEYTKEEEKAIKTAIVALHGEVSVASQQALVFTLKREDGKVDEKLKKIVEDTFEKNINEILDECKRDNINLPINIENIYNSITLGESK